MPDKRIIPESELIMNADGSIYHLHLKPHEISDTIITVGDPDRVAEVSKHFDRIQHKVQHREFLTHTGFLNNKRLSVISTGIGTDNIDIVLNELDALVNIDFATRTVKDALTSLQIIRMGTSGSVNEEVPMDSIVLSEIAIGMDGLMNFYEYQNSIQETIYLEAFINHIKPYFKEIKPYIGSADPVLLERFSQRYSKGTTVTASGFYGPQGRTLRAKNEFKNFATVINQFRHTHFRISNLEMETAGIYAFGKLLGHQCLSINAILADRVNQNFSANPQTIIENMILDSLEIITTL